MAAEHTHKTALVLIPPRELWGPIQAIRKLHDRQVRRWMPHITLIYPFRPPDELAPLLPLLRKACRELAPFELRLASLQYFHHGASEFTLWLAPEPRGALVQLHNALWRVVPDCDDVRRHGGGFTPHLSLGQARGRPRTLRLREELQAAWKELRFTVTEVGLIRRGDPPDDVFKVAERLAIGDGSPVSHPAQE